MVLRWTVWGSVRRVRAAACSTAVEVATSFSVSRLTSSARLLDPRSVVLMPTGCTTTLAFALYCGVRVKLYAAASPTRPTTHRAIARFWLRKTWR